MEVIFKYETYRVARTNYVGVDEYSVAGNFPRTTHQHGQNKGKQLTQASRYQHKLKLLSHSYSNTELVLFGNYLNRNDNIIAVLLRAVLLT